jgi:hypothetical protein
MESLNTIIEKYGLESNAEGGYYNDENFKNNPDAPCYIPENAENIDDVYSRNRIKEVVTNWLDTEEAKEYLLESYDGVMPTIDDKFINEFVERVYGDITWEFPSTYLDSLTY